MSNPSVGDKARYAAERVMQPILERWFTIDLEPVNLDSNAENAAVDLAWALDSAGLLLPIELVVPGKIAGEQATMQAKVEQALYAAEVDGLLRSAGRIDIARRVVAALTTPPSCACGYPDRHTNLPCSERRDVDD